MLVIIFIIILYFAVVAHFIFWYPELRWDWSKISINNIFFPPSFFWGTATASHQVEGDCNNNWSEFEKGIKSDGQPNITKNQKSGKACNHWNLYDKDIDLISQIGVSHYRFSVEWSKIEPFPGEYNQEILDHYSRMIDLLIEKKITPVITLHHFTHPLWFDRIGAFEKEENLSYFISFCERVFKEYSDKVSFWCTINEPAVVATQGYFTGLFPPGKKSPQLAAIVLKNLLEAHVRVYRLLKGMKNGSNVKIGLVKNINQFEPWRRWHLFDWLISWAVNSFFNRSSLDFLRIGIYKIRIPGIAWIYHKNKDAMGSIDFFGLNYYSHNHLKANIFSKELFSLEYKEGDIMTDMPYTIYGEGIYRAIQMVSSLRVPIIITENGIADRNDDRRELYIERYLYAVSRAISDGYDVQGYFYWSLMDNFEWAFGYDMKFGLYSVDFKTQERTLRDGSQSFIKIVQSNT